MGTGEVSLPPYRAGSPVNTGTTTATIGGSLAERELNGRTRDPHCAPTKRTIEHAYQWLTRVLKKGARDQKKNEYQKDNS